jgi:hypothetical protein
MPNYYIFEPACNTSETGSEFPQVQKMAPGYDYKSPNSVYALTKATEEFPGFTPNLDYFIVHAKAKLTDLLSATTVDGGFLISPRFKMLWEKFILTSHRFYPAKVLYKKRFYEFYWLHIISNLTRFVDYRKSTFFAYYNYRHNLGYISIKSKEDLAIKKAKIKKDNPEKTITIWAETICLNEHFDKSLDLFTVGGFDSNYYISERMKAVIESEKITGCNIHSAVNLES